MGKHSEKEQEIKRLNKIIALKDKEIFDIKTSLADVFQNIRTIYELLIDEIDKKKELDRLPNRI